MARRAVVNSQLRVWKRSFLQVGQSFLNVHMVVWVIAFEKAINL